MNEKRCPKCKEVKPFECFSEYAILDKHHNSECKVCHSERLRDYRLRNIEKVRARDREYRKSENGKASKKRSAQKVTAEQKRKYLLRRYKITLEQYDELLKNQNGLCKICKSLPSGKYLAVDHNHETGEVRGLLCEKCNMALGLARDDKNILQKMIEYLNKTLIG